MAKRYVILIEKTGGEKAVLSAATMRELGLSDEDTIAITSSTGFSVLPVVAGPVLPNQIKLPHKAALMQKGERLAVEPVSDSLLQRSEPERLAVTPRAPAEFTWDPVDDASFDEIVGLAGVKSRIEQTTYYLTHPEWFLIRRSLPPRVFLFFGPYGCGKTMLARAMASRLAHPADDGVALDIKLKGLKPTDIKDPYLGMSARSAELYLSAARAECDRGSTVLLLMDEIESLVASRSNGQIHEEYRDVVNSMLQGVQGVRELDSEARIGRLLRDPEVLALRDELANVVRKKGRRDPLGDILLAEQDWTEEVKGKMLRLRSRIMEAGGVSTLIIVGTTNDPCQIDEGFISRAGDQVFFVPRPGAEAIEQMLRQHLDGAFFDLHEQERGELAQDAFQHHLTGRDILLSWLQPLRSRAPGSLTIMGHKTIHSHMPHATAGIEWEADLYRRLRERGHLSMAQQVAAYLEQVRQPTSSPRQANGTSKSPPRSKQPALFEL